MLTNKKSLLALSIVSALTLTACGSDNDDNVIVEPPVPPVIVVPEAPADVAFVATLTVVSATDGALITTPVTISLLEGDVATDKVTDIDGNAITSVTSNGGVASFTLKAGEKPTLRAVINAEGFVPTNQVLDLTNPDTTFTAAITLTPAVQGAGVAAASQDATVTAGQVAKEEKVTATEAEATAEVVVPVGTTMQDAAGNAVTGTSVTMKVETAGATASATKAAVGDLIPAGLNDDASGTTARQPVAAANITMVDSNGNQIKKFSSPIKVSFAVPSSSGLKENDTLKVSSYNEDTAKWTRDEATATIVKLADNSLAASFETDHLTLFTTAANTERCDQANVFDISEIGVTGADFKDLTFTMFGGTGAAIRNSELTQFIGKSKDQGIAKDAKGRIVVSYKGTEVFNSGATNVDVCGFKLPSLAQAVTDAKATKVPTGVRMTFQCSNPGAPAAIPLTGAAVFAINISDDLTESAIIFTGNNGTYSATLDSGKEYSVFITLPDAFAVENLPVITGATTARIGRFVAYSPLSAATINSTTLAFTKQCDVATGSGVTGG